VQLAPKRFPGAPVSLDALCRRFAIDLTQRQKHSARLDAELLASVYLELIGGRQPGLDFAIQVGAAAAGALVARVARLARPHAPSAEEEARHRGFLQKIKGALWLSEA
jgi:DNA polymerase III subunit epsilon